MNKIIILGMDNTGKTTLAESLSKELKVKLIKSTGPKVTKETMVYNMLINLESPEPVIFERYNMFEEIIYGNILRGESKFNFKDYMYEQTVLHKPLIIYCRPDKEKIFNFGTREQMKGVIEEKEKLLKAWDELISKISSDIEVYVYNFNVQSLNYMVNYIGNLLKLNVVKKLNQ